MATPRKAASKAQGSKGSSAKSAKGDEATAGLLLKVGQKAPDFRLPASTGETIKLSQFRGEDGKNVILYFYPRDNTPGCTQEACDFQDQIGRLQDAETVVLGISTDSLSSHEKFAAKHSLSFPLLSDPDHVVCEKYGVWAEKKNYGKTYFGIQRATFLIGKDGKIKEIWPKVKVKGHVDEVLTRLQEQNALPSAGD